MNCNPYKYPLSLLVIITAAVSVLIYPAAMSLSTVKNYINPVISANFPDPSVLNDGDIFYAYSTNSGETMPCEKSTDLVNWTSLPDAMPVLPDWARRGRTWAPNVRAVIPGKAYIAYFTAWDIATNKQAIGFATGPSAAGPFSSPPGAKPMIEQADLGGAIDSSCFIDTDGSRYLVWKNDGNSMGKPTWLWIQRLSDDGQRLLDMPTKLIREDQPWEGNLIEGPTLWKHNSKYFLFYSANDYASCNYAVGYAISNSLLGPYTKLSTSPWLSSSANACGPGGEDIIKDNSGRDWMAYHVWGNGPRSYRCMYINRLKWNGDVPALIAP